MGNLSIGYVKSPVCRFTDNDREHAICSRCHLFLDLAPDFVKPYKINDQTINQAFELKHGKSVRTFNMDKVSNGPFIEVCSSSILIGKTQA